MSRAFGGSDSGRDRSEAATSEAVRQVASARERQQLRAEQRRQQGLEGLCEGCGQPIPPERLQRLPSATRCVGCQARADGRR